jgi:hypothetical protein
MAENLCKNYTPDACAKALVSYLPIGMGEWVHEPHSGGGSFLRALDAKDGVWLTASDLEPDDGITYRDGKRPKRADFLTWDWRSQAGVLPENPPDWIIGNPPYTTAEEHIRRAVEVTGRHVVFVLRLAMLEGVKRGWSVEADASSRGHRLGSSTIL